MSHTSTYQKTRNRLEVLSIIIFWGAVWGIIASTFGYMTERVSTPLVALIQFMIALPCLAVAYRQTGLKISAFYIAIVASVIRCVHLPFMGDAEVILTSVVWILVEGLVTSMFIFVAQFKPLPKADTFQLKPMWTTVTLTISVMLTIAI